MMRRPIDRFVKEHGYLSNFYFAPFMFLRSYDTVEHAYQSLKSFDPKVQNEIRRAPTPAAAKRMGHKVRLREDWDLIRLMLMRHLVTAKFVQNPGLGEQLIKTGSRPLVEGNHWGDRFWGVDEHGVGENHLGQILMELRQELQSATIGFFRVPD